MQTAGKRPRTSAVVSLRAHGALLIRLRTFRTPFIAGVLAALVAALLKAYDNYGANRDIVREAAFNDSCYGTFTMIVGFVMGFRTNQAYARFWEGASCIYMIMGSWFDAASALFVFCSKKDEVAEARAEFQHTLVRLISLCMALMFAELEDHTEDIESDAFAYDLIDPLGIDRRTLKTIRDSEKAVEVVFHQIHHLMISAMDSGVIVTPPPIMAQAFADVSGALIKFHEAEKLAHIPFPFSFRCVAEFLLVVHWMLTPIVVCFWVGSSGAAGFFSFILTFALWSLNAIAVELDNPFAGKGNGFDCEQMQHKFNKRLVTCLVLAEEPPPSLSETAIRDAHRVGTGTNERRGSVVNRFSGLRPFLTLQSFKGLTSRTLTWASLSASEAPAELPPDSQLETPDLVDCEAGVAVSSHSSRGQAQEFPLEVSLDNESSARAVDKPRALEETTLAVHPDAVDLVDAQERASFVLSERDREQPRPALLQPLVLGGGGSAETVSKPYQHSQQMHYALDFGFPVSMPIGLSAEKHRPRTRWASGPPASSKVTPVFPPEGGTFTDVSASPDNS